MKKLLLFSLFLSCQTAFSQTFLAGAQAAGMANVTAASQGLNSLFGNPAGLTSLEKWGVIAAAERKFMLSELQTFAAGVAVPVKLGSFGLTFQTFGYEEFRSQKISLAYARRLWKNLSLGAQFDYFQTRIPEYGSKGALSFELGLQAQLTKQLVVGAHFFNPAQLEFAENEPLASVFKLGAAWLPSEKTTVAIEFEKDIDFPLRIKSGFEFRAAPPLWLRAGFATNPAMVHFGIGLALNSSLKVDVAGSWHQVLGFSPATALSYSHK